MNNSTSPTRQAGLDDCKCSRRTFLKGCAAAATLMGSRRAWAAEPQALAASSGGKTPPNLLLITSDQHHAGAMSALGCRHVQTPNLDRLFRDGTCFAQSYTTNPICSPARSSWFTGRMPSETGVKSNGLPIREGMPTMGNLLSDGGYQTFYLGKWHLPRPYPATIPGFQVVPTGVSGQGHLADASISQAFSAMLTHQRLPQPFAAVVNFLQPHDICGWLQDHRKFPLKQAPYGLDESQLPPLPPNFDCRLAEGAWLKSRTSLRPQWEPIQWRYYLWAYYRHVEMVDAEIGAVLDALEDSPYADNTVIIYTSDHGEGMAHHGLVTKNVLYDPAARVPMVACWRGHIGQGVRDKDHLVSGLDLLPTMCDYAGVACPAGVHGQSLRPLLEGRAGPWRSELGIESTAGGHALRSQRYKYIAYTNDPVEQLFDMAEDPLETKNLVGEASMAAVLEDHRRRLAQWDSRLDKAPVVKKTPAASAAANSDE